MKLVKTIEVVNISCDGCGYLIGMTDEEAESGMDIEDFYAVLSIPEVEPFHFHVAARDRRDCFRYWAHNPRVMKNSLEDREMQEEVIDEFMSMFLYREDPHHPGIEKPPVKIIRVKGRR